LAEEAAPQGTPSATEPADKAAENHAEIGIGRNVPMINAGISISAPVVRNTDIKQRMSPTAACPGTGAEAALPRFLRGWSWEAEEPDSVRSATFSLTAEPWPPIPDCIKNNPDIQSTLRRRSELFKIVTRTLP
jgi:hypothetical protein